MATGTGEWQGNTLTTGVSGAYRYVKITNAVFNTTTGVTTITFDIGTYCSYGNFQGSNFTSTGSFTDSYQVYGPDIYGLHAGLVENVAHNATRHFTEGCYYYSSSQGQLLESNLDFVWQPTLPTYAVSYNANGGQGAPTSQTKSWGETLTLTSTAPTRAGYTFGGWNTSADGTGTAYAAGASYTANANVILYAQWTLNTWSVDYYANGGSGSVASQTKQYNVPLVLASSGFTKSYYTLDGWATSTTGGVAYALGATYTGNAALSLYAHWKVNAPAAPTNVSAVRNTDAKATISWTRAAGADTTYTRIYVERSADGGTFEVLSAISGTSTSYADNTITANHAYTYRVRAWNSTGYSSYATASAIYTTPAAPASLTGERTGSGTSVLLTVGNDGTRNATGFDVQRRAADAATWTDATVASSTGTPVATITIDNMGGSYYFRVRNTRGTLASGWTESGLIVTITPPNAPTLVNPSSGAVISASGTTQAVTFAWQHNPIDGSAQTAAQVRYRKSTASAWTTASATTAQTLSATLDEGYTYVWQARTKGAADDYGAWSNTQSFDLYSPPVVTITQPTGTVIGMPLAYAISYNDAHGVFASGSVSIKLNGATIYSEQLPATATTIGTASTIAGEITTAEFLPTSGTSYTIEFSVRSSDTLSVTVSAAMPVDMGEPTHGQLAIVDDANTGYAALTASYDNYATDITYNGTAGTGVTVQSAAIRSLAVDGMSVQEPTPPIKFNQLGHAMNAAGSWYVNNATDGNATTNVTAGGALEVISANAGTFSGQLIVRQVMDAILAGHKYLCVAETSQNTMQARWNLLDNWTGIKSSSDTNGLETAVILDAPTSSATAPYLSITMKPGGNEWTHPVGAKVTFYKLGVVDLTAIYGAGNEPTSTDDERIAFLKAYALAHPSYDAGSLISVPIQVVEGRNLYNPDTRINGSWINDSGVIAGAAGTYYSDKIPVAVGETYTFATNIVGDANKRVVAYDSNDSFVALLAKITVTLGTRKSATFTIPVNTAYVRVSGNMSDTEVQLELGTTPTPYVPYGALGLKVDSANLLDTITKFKKGSTSYADCTITNNGNGTYTVSGTNSLASTWGFYSNTSSLTLPAGTYTLSGTGTIANCVLGFEINGSMQQITAGQTKTVTYDQPATLTRWVIFVLGSETISGTCCPMINVGSTALQNVPYSSTVTPIPLDGNVLASLPDGTKDTLNVDSAGHVTLTKNTGAADLGTLTWSKRNNVGMQTSGLSSLIKNPSGNDYLPNVYADVATQMRWTQLVNGGTSSGGVSVSGGYVCISTTETDAAAFKTAMTGDSLYYPLATPTTVDLGYIDLPALADGVAVDVVASLATSFTLVGYNGQVAATSISVSRVNPDGTSVMLLDHGASGSGILDKYAPLNTHYQYEVVTHAESTAIAVEYVDNFIETLRWFVYWGADSIAWAEWNPAGGYSLKRPQKKRVHYVGREYPVSYDGTALDEAHSVTFTVLDRDEWQNGFIQLMHDGGRGVYKSVDGKVFMADVEINNTPNYTSITTIGTVALSITRIDSDAL